MKKDKVDIVRDIVATQTNHWIFFPLVLFFANSAGIQVLAGKDMAGFLLLGVVFFGLCCIMQLKVRYVFLLPVPVILYGAFLMLMDFSTWWIKVAFALLLAGYFLYSLVMMLREITPFMGVIPAYIIPIIMFGIWVMAKAEHVKIDYLPYYMGIIVTTILYLLSIYLDNYMRFTYLNDETAASMPRTKIFRSGMFMSGSFIALTSLGMLGIALFSLPDSIWENGILMLLRAIVVNLLKGDFGETEEEVEDKPMQQMTLPPSGDSSLLGAIIEKILMAMLVVLTLVAAFIIIQGLIRAIRYFRFPEYRRGNYKVVLDDGTQDEYEKLGLEHSEKVSRDREKRTSINQKIRRLYKKKVIDKVADEKKRDHMTAREFVKEQCDETVANVYEKARYSDMQCNKEDLKNMQTACRK